MNNFYIVYLNACVGGYTVEEKLETLKQQINSNNEEITSMVSDGGRLIVATKKLDKERKVMHD